MTKKQELLIKFAERTLAILEQQKDWSSDTPEDIAVQAMNLGLAETDENGEFKRLD